MNPVAGSAIVERSGTMRIASLAEIPGALCHEGRDQIADCPPPAAPPPDPRPSFHTVWASGQMLETVRPPTPVT